MGNRIGSGSSSYSVKSTQYGGGSGKTHHHHKGTQGTGGPIQAATYTPESTRTPAGTGQYPSFLFNSDSQQPQYPGLFDPQSFSTTA